MYTIKIDTSSKDSKKAFLYRGAILVDSIEFNQGIATNVLKLISKNNLSPFDITEVSHLDNPTGTSFTGLRLGYTFLNVFNYLVQGENYKFKSPIYHMEPNITPQKASEAV